MVEILIFNDINLGDVEQHVVAHCVLPDADLGLKSLYISILHAEPELFPFSFTFNLII